MARMEGDLYMPSRDAVEERHLNWRPAGLEIASNVLGLKIFLEAILNDWRLDTVVAPKM